MKRLIFSCMLICLMREGFAQKKDSIIIFKDTINLRGTLYKSNGTPAANIFLSSKQKDLKYNRFPIYARTDSNGYFEFKGAKPQDTLSIEYPMYGTKLNYMNKGSRYLVIYLPPERLDLNSTDPVVIVATRKYPKLLSTFKIATRYDGPIEDSFSNAPSFPGGVKNFFTYLKTNLVYPNKAIILNKEGIVEIDFLIERDGSLRNFKIIKGIGYGCDEEVIRVLKNSPKWQPGIAYGRHVAVHEKVSVEFKLTDN